ncbi:MAG: hypothetical protein V3S77_09910 [Acidiferrobacterales bacterium]
MHISSRPAVGHDAGWARNRSAWRDCEILGTSRSRSRRLLGQTALLPAAGMQEHEPSCDGGDGE